jgi:hypothetical protein
MFLAFGILLCCFLARGNLLRGFPAAGFAAVLAASLCVGAALPTLVAGVWTSEAVEGLFC